MAAAGKVAVPHRGRRRYVGLQAHAVGDEQVGQQKAEGRCREGVVAASLEVERQPRAGMMLRPAPGRKLAMFTALLAGARMCPTSLRPASVNQRRCLGKC